MTTPTPTGPAQEPSGLHNIAKSAMQEILVLCWLDAGVTPTVKLLGIGTKITAIVERACQQAINQRPPVTKE